MLLLLKFLTSIKVNMKSVIKCKTGRKNTSTFRPFKMKILVFLILTCLAVSIHFN